MNYQYHPKGIKMMKEWLFRQRSAATAIIVVVIWILDDISGAIERLLDAVPRVIGCPAIPLVAHVLVELVGVEVGLVPHHLLEGLDRSHLAHPHLVLPRAPVHHQVRVVVEDNGRDHVVVAQVPNEVHCRVAGNLPTMPAHRSADIQSEQHCVVLNHGLRSLPRSLGHIVHGVQVLIGPLQHSGVGPNPMEHLGDIGMGNIMVLPMYSCRRYQILQGLSVLILDIHSKYDDLKIPNVHILPQVAQQLVGLLVAGVAVGVMAVGDEDVHEEPVVGSEVLLQHGVQLHHEAVAVEEGVAHGSAPVRVDVPDLSRGGRTGGLLETAGKQGCFCQEMGMGGIDAVWITHLHVEVWRVRQLKLLSLIIRDAYTMGYSFASLLASQKCVQQ